MIQRPPRLTVHSRCGIADLFRNRSGISSVEFALILPLMVFVFLGSVDVSNVLLLDRRVTTTANTLADLVAQTAVVTDGELDDIFTAAEAVVTPFDPDALTLVVSSIETDTKGKTRVGWSEAQGGGALKAGGKFTLPSGLDDDGTSVILAEVTYTYNSGLGILFAGGITLTDRFYLRPRRSVTVERGN